jgi:hypothetical protein
VAIGCTPRAGVLEGVNTDCAEMVRVLMGLVSCVLTQAYAAVFSAGVKVAQSAALFGRRAFGDAAVAVPANDVIAKATTDAKIRTFRTVSPLV